MKKIGLAVAVVIVILITIGSIASKGGNRQDYRGLSDKHPEARNTAASSPRPKPANPDAGVRAAGWEMAKRTVPARLKNRHTAAFPWDTVSYVKSADGTYEVSGEVEVQNDFSAKIRHPWKVKIAADGENWKGKEVWLAGNLIAKE